MRDERCPPLACGCTSWTRLLRPTAPSCCSRALSAGVSVDEHQQLQSTAQHSTAQHSTAQHSHCTVCRNAPLAYSRRLLSHSLSCSPFRSVFRSRCHSPLDSRRACRLATSSATSLSPSEDSGADEDDDAPSPFTILLLLIMMLMARGCPEPSLPCGGSEEEHRGSSSHHHHISPRTISWTRCIRHAHRSRKSTTPASTTGSPSTSSSPRRRHPPSRTRAARTAS